MKLTSSSEQHFKNLIPWQPLPDTYKDAIKVTRKLRSAFGVSYIWIDALCVIQDSAENWQQESSAMGDTHRSSFCNLAACVGPDSYSGLFQDCDPFHHILALSGLLWVIRHKYFKRSRNMRLYIPMSSHHTLSP